MPRMLREHPRGQGHPVSRRDYNQAKGWDLGCFVIIVLFAVLVGWWFL